MRTKVEKRRVRQEPASALVGSPAISQPAPLPSQDDAGVAPSANVLAASTVLPGAAGELQPDGERRPVSISEAERLAAANHVVVALGPPVIMGPTRLMFDGKGDGGESVAGGGGGGGGDGITPALTDGVNKIYKLSAAQSTGVTVTSEEKAIKKPPKKRRNNEKKVEVALDLSTTSVMQSVIAKELHPPVTESLMISAPIPVQLQHPPITPPTPSPQHPLTCSPQHGSLNNSALLCRSPPNPTHLLQQTPPSSSEPVLTDTASDSADMVPSADISDFHTPAEEGTAVTPFVRSDSEVLPLPESDLVLPLSQTHPAEVPSLVQQPEAIQTLDAEEGELSSATSTSLLQPPTWLLTPQENPPGREGSEHEFLAAATNQRTTQAPQETSTEPLVTSPAKTVNKAGKKTASKSKSAKSRKTADEGVKNTVGKDKSTSNSCVVSQSKDSRVTACIGGATGNASIPPPKGGSSSKESSKSPSKSEKPQKKKPKEGDEDSQRRLQQIEDSINSVIARYVYNSDNVLDFDRLRQAAREADAKAADADAHNTTANSRVAAETKSAAAVACSDSVNPVSVGMKESQQCANACSGVSVDSETPKPKKKAAAKKKPSEPKAASGKEIEADSTATTEGTVHLETVTNSPKKKPKKSKEKKAKEVTADLENGSEFLVADKKTTKPQAKKATKAQSKKTKAQSKDTTEAQSKDTSKVQSKDTTAQSKDTTEAQTKDSTDVQSMDTSDTQPKGTTEVTVDATSNGEAKPPPAKKRKTSKKKEVVVPNPVESQPSSDKISNGHLETEPPVETPKPAKKRKSKPKAKAVTKADDKTPDNLTVPKTTEMSSAADVSSGTSLPQQENKKSDKPQAKPKPKKARKRKSDNAEDGQSSVKMDAENNKGEEVTGEENKDGANSESVNKESVNAEANADNESVKPPPKKKKKKEPKEGEKVETKKKKSPSKSKKGKAPVTDSQNSTAGEAGSLHNSLPNSQSGESGEVKSSENGETKSTEEAGTCTEEGQEAKSTTTPVEKKVKKTLDEVICPDCGHRTRGQAALSRHMKKLHEKSVVLPYPCPKQPNCDYSASKVSLLARHMLTHGLYMCSRCQFTVDAKDKYEEHLQSEHNVKLDCKLCKKCCRYVKCDTMPMEQHLAVCQGPVPFTCDVCGKEFKYESSLKVHHHTHFPDQPKLYHCTQCEYASNYRANLHKHVQNMHMQRPRDIKCQLCEKMFSTEDNMRRHMKIHTQVRPYKCHKCEKAFKSQCALRGHLVSHEVARPYRCNIDNCHREFRTAKFLKSHQEEFHRLIPKKYHCKVEGCGFSFFKLSHLKRHEISHTGERNFHCDHPGCGKSFRHADNLKVHLRQHNNDRPITCPVCKFTCRQKTSLQWHMKKEHDQSLQDSTGNNGASKDVVIPLDGTPLEGFTLPKGMTFPEGFTLPEGLTLPEGVKLPEGVDLADGVEVVELEKINVIIPAGEGEELPVTITELRPMDLYDFHSDNDSSDEARPGVFRRDKTKMASAAPLPPAPKELLMKNSVVDVLAHDGLKPLSEVGTSKSKKKKSSSKKAVKSSEAVSKEGPEETKKDNEEARATEDKKKKKKKASPAKKASPESKKKTTTPKSKKKAAKKAEEKEQKEEQHKKNTDNQTNEVNEKVDNQTKEVNEKVDQKNEEQADDIKDKTVNEEKLDGECEAKQNDASKTKDDQSGDKQDSEKFKEGNNSKNEIKTDEAEPEGKAQSKSPSKTKKSSTKKKAPAKAAPKAEVAVAEKPKPAKAAPKAEVAVAEKPKPAKAAPKAEVAVAEKPKPAKTKAPAKGKKSPKTRASPKKPTSPKGKPAKPATRKTPPRKAATAKKGGKAGGKKTAPKKGTAKKKTAAKKKAPPKKKTTKKGKDKEEKSADVETSAAEQKEEETPVTEPKPKETPVTQNRMLTARRPRETRNSLAAAEEASSPIRPSTPVDSEEENMPQGAGSPYREFDSQDMDDSSPEPRDSPSPPPSPPRVEVQALFSPVQELDSSPKGDEDVPEMAETQGEEAEEVSDVEDIMNDIPLTPPRAPAPPPQESSDEEEMIPSPPTHMPLSADTSDTAAPSSVLTDQPGSQAPDFQQPHSREECQQPHSHQDFQQPHSREEFQQPLSQQPQSVEYPQHHSREEILQPHSREEYPQHHSREEYPQHHSREEYPQHQSREEYPQHQSREEYPQHQSREEYPQHHSREEYSQPHSREEYTQPLSREEYPQPHSREEYSQPLSREEYPQPLSREEYPQPLSREEYPQPLSREEYPQPLSREEYPQPLSREEYSQPHSREEYSQPHSREEYPQPQSREEYPQPQSREDYSQQHSHEDLQPQGSVPEPMSEPVHSVRSEGLPDDVAMSHPVAQFEAVASQTMPTSEAESAYQYLQGLAQSGESISEPLAGEPSRLQQLEALAEKPHEDSRGVTDMVKSPVGAVPTSVITSLSPSATSLPISTPETSSRRMEILSTDRQVEQALIRDSPVLPRLGEGPYDAFSTLNPLAASAARDNNNLFPAPPSTPTFMRLTESEAMLQRQRMTTPFLPTAQPPERSLSRLPESSLQPPNPTALLRRPATMAEGMFSGTPGMPQAMPRNPFTNTWAGQDVRPSHWGQAPTYLQRPTNAPTTPFPFPTKDNYQFMFDPTVRPGVTDRNMFASLSSSQSQRDLASEPSPFQLDRFDLSTYFGSHPYSGATGLDYSRSAVSAASKTFDERYRPNAVSMSEFRPLPPTTSTDMFSGIGVGVNSLNSASFNLDKYAMYGRDPMYHAAAQQLSDNTNSAFLTHATPTQHSVFDRDYPHRSLYPQNPAYPLFNERQYPAAAKLTGHPTPAAMSHERDFMARPSANENQMQDPYRCGMLYNVVNRYSFE